MSYESGFNTGLGGLQYIAQQIDAGRERKRQEGFDQQRQQVFDNEQQRQGQQDNAQKLGRLASYLTSVPAPMRPQAYAQMRSQIDQLGQSLGLPPAPDVWDESHLPEVEQVAQWGNQASALPSGLREFHGMTQGFTAEDEMKARRVAMGLEPRAGVQSNAPYTFQQDVGPDGRSQTNVLDKRTGDGRVLGQGGPQAGAPQDLSAVLNLSARHRFQPTSFGRTPQENARLPGAAVNSNHLTENALDFSIQGKSPQEIQAFVADMAPAGWIGKIHTKGTAPHLHFDFAGASGQNPFIGRRKEDEAAAVEGAKEQAKYDAQVTNAGRVGNASGEVAAGEEVGKEFGAQFNALQQKANQAQAENSKLIPLREMLSKSYTGPGANAYLGAQRAAAMFGFDVEGLGDAEAAKAISNQLALSLRNPAGGEGMPGALSDADRNFLVSSVPSLANTPAGWRTMINMRLALNQYAVQQAQVAEQMRRDGIPVQDIPGRMREWAQMHPVFKSKQPATPSGGLSPQEQAELDALRKQFGRR